MILLFYQKCVVFKVIVACIPELGGDFNFYHQDIIVVININRC